MRRQHRPPSGAPTSVTEELDRQARTEPEAALLQGVRVALAMVTGAVVLTTFADLSVGDVAPALLLRLKAIDLGLLALVYTLTRWTRIKPYATVVAWSVPVGLCTMLALSGIATGDSHGAVIMCVGALLVTATLFPWGIRAQLVAAACAGVAIAANLHWVPSESTIPVSYQAIAAAVLTLIVSVVITYERQVTWQAMHGENMARVRAEAQTATLHRHLEQVVNERTALLETTRQDLERQIAAYEATLLTLHRNEQQLRDIVDNSSALIFVKDLAGHYRFMGTRGERHFGVPREQIIGKTAADFFPAATAAASAANDRLVLTTRQPLEAEDTVTDSEGTRTYLTLKVPLRDAAGEIYGLCGISTDITQRKQMEDQLRRTETLLSSVIESSNEAIWSLDCDYRFTALNWVVRRRFPELFGTHPEIGMSLDACLPPETRRYWRARYEQALSGQHLVVEHPITIADAPYHILISLNPVREGGRVSGVVIFTKDITGFRRTEEALRQHQAELAHALRLSTIGEMSTGLAQDLRQPLAAIAAIARDCRQALRSGRIDPAAFAQRIAPVTAAALGAAESLRDLRRLVRKDSSMRDGVDVNEVTRNAARIIEARHPELPLQLALAPQLPLVHGDRVQLEQVVLNLLLNALDALHGVPTELRMLTVHTRLTDASTVEVSVCDTGTGLDPGMGESVFAPFVSTKLRGLGMGLAISRSIVAAHGGQLWSTPNPAGGSIFHFTVPLP